jgi:hypothetical protein
MVSDFRRIKVYTAKPLVSEPSPFEAKIPIAKLKHHISPGSSHIAAELIQA